MRRHVYQRAIGKSSQNWSAVAPGCFLMMVWCSLFAGIGPIGQTDPIAC